MSNSAAMKAPTTRDLRDGSCDPATGLDVDMSAFSALRSPATEARWPRDPEDFSFTDQELEGFLLLVDGDSLAHSEGDSDDARAASAPGAATKRPTDQDASPGAPSDDAKRARSTALAAKRRREYQLRQKTELDELRKASAALGGKLALLVSKKEALRFELQRVDKGRNATSWREIALRQLQRRIEAEEANRALRLLVRQKHIAAQSLSLILQSELTAAESDKLAALGCLQRQGKEVVQLCNSDLALVASLVNEIDATYLQADAVLGDYQLPAAESRHYTSRKGWRENPHSGDGYFETIESWGIPFDVDVAVEAMIKSLPSMLSRACQPATIPTVDPANTMAIKFFFSGTDEEHRQRHYESIFVAKVFFEGDRAILRWRFVSKERAHGGSNGVQFSESGWGIARREAGNYGEHPRSAGTRVTLCTRFGIYGPAASTSARSQSLKIYIEMLFSDYKDDMMEWNHAIEEVVMKNAAASRRFFANTA